MRTCDVHVVRKITLLMTEFAARVLYPVPSVRVKSEVYLGVYIDTTCYAKCLNEFLQPE